MLVSCMSCEDANVKLTRVITDILGVSGRAILAALIAGETDPERLADCTNVRVKADRADIVPMTGSLQAPGKRRQPTQAWNLAIR